MAFALRNLSVIAYQNGFTLWHYKAEGDRQAMELPHFFTPAGDNLSVGDMIMVSGTEGGKILIVAPGAVPHSFSTVSL